MAPVQVEVAMSSELVRDVMHHGVVSCHPDMKLREAAGLMANASVRAIVVVDGDCGLSGIVSTSDLVNATLSDSTAVSWQSLCVKDVMTRQVLTVTPDTALSEAAKLLVDHRVHRLVVVDASGNKCNPIGIISMGDVVRRLAEQ